MLEEELIEHLKNDCPYMLVSCVRCHYNPVQRRNFKDLNDHSDAKCIAILKEKIWKQELLIK